MNALLLFLGIMQPEILQPCTLDDLKPFPTRDEVDKKVTYNREYHDLINRLLHGECDDRKVREWYRRRCDNQDRYWVWEHLAEAHRLWWTEEGRLVSLTQLRKDIGWQNYYRGWMPDHVNWREFWDIEHESLFTFKACSEVKIKP